MDREGKNGRPSVVVIAGPTASGKSGLAVELALALEGEIVNADAMQVYRGMDIGTAKPSVHERKGVPHHLLDVVNPDEAFNASIYRAMALPLIREISSKGNVCFVVGGSGLYIRSLLGGLFACPPSDSTLRDSLRREFKDLRNEDVHERLRRLDPEAARKIHPNDRLRIIRAFEIIRLAGRLPSDLSSEHGFTDRQLHALMLCLDVDREMLYRRINERTLSMVESGLKEETEALLRQGYSPELKPMKAIGYRHMVQHLKGEVSFEAAVHTMQRDTRRYAKRQLTWFRAEPEARWIDPEDFDFVLQKIKDLYKP
jgi:tRNA dimethylallyltransferase